MTAPGQTEIGATGAPRGVELNGINVIDEAERHGEPRSLFRLWFASNISVLGISYGAFTLAFGVSFWQAVIAGVIGIIASFALCGIVAIAGIRGRPPPWCCPAPRSACAATGCPRCSRSVHRRWRATCAWCRITGRALSRRGGWKIARPRCGW